MDLVIIWQSVILSKKSHTFVMFDINDIAFELNDKNKREMANFFTSLFSSTVEETTDGLSKSDRKKFDILKYDGVRAQKIGKFAYAIKCFTEAIAIDEDLETMSYLVGAYTMTHEYEEALAVLDRMVELNPELLNTLFTRASVLSLLNKNEEVVEECNRIISYEPENPHAYYLKGRAFRAKGELDAALDTLTKCLELKPDFSDAALLRAEVYLIKGNGQSALNDVEAVIAREGEEENAFLLKGSIHAFLKENAKAEEDFNKVLELNPFNEDASLRLANLLIEAGQYDEALQVLDDLIELSPSLSTAYTERARLKGLMGDTDGQESDLANAAALEDGRETHVGQADFSNMYKGGIF